MHLRQIQLTGSICLRLQKLFHVAVLGDSIVILEFHEVLIKALEGPQSN